MGLAVQPVDQYHLSPLSQTIEVGVCVRQLSCKSGAGALSNLAMIADWNYTSRIENTGRRRPNRVADSARTCGHLSGKKTGYINVFSFCKIESFRPHARNSFCDYLQLLMLMQVCSACGISSRGCESEPLEIYLFFLNLTGSFQSDWFALIATAII